MASDAGEVLAGIAGRLAAVGRTPQGIADGHAVRIEADRAGADLPAEAGASSVRRAVVGSGSRGAVLTAASEQRRGGLWGVVKK